MKRNRSGPKDDMEVQCIQACQRGEKAAFRTLFLRYGDPIFRLAYRFTGNADDAEDLSQEIFVRVFQKIDSFRCQSSFSTWLYRLAANHCMNHCRKPQRSQPL